MKKDDNMAIPILNQIFFSPYISIWRVHQVSSGYIIRLNELSN
jgi:hypothetical protein